MKTTVLSFFIITGMLLADVSAQNTDFTDYQTLAVNGINMAYRDIGDGPALVLLHGFSGTGEAWNPLLEDLSAHFRLIVPDLRGHGRSINPSGHFTHIWNLLKMFLICWIN